ncbi:MAG TPA: Uma2 family endonuclease [Gemmatimonadales bacterium]|nr:Uma2 family endonuclease [Gemmatimonadales bacterium]
MPRTDSAYIDQLLEGGAVKLEITRGIPTWEAFPGLRHQVAIDLIRASIKPVDRGGDSERECAHFSDVLISFRDGSLKRPDIAIFCTRPPIQDEALTQVPAAVVEVISPGYEYKDLELNPQFYPAEGVEDVIIVDPRAGLVTHHNSSGATTEHAPVTLTLNCGCQCTVPQVG